jgi:hypothetical protein
MTTSNSESIKNNIRDQLKWDDSVDVSQKKNVASTK